MAVRICLFEAFGGFWELSIWDSQEAAMLFTKYQGINEACRLIWKPQHTHANLHRVGIFTIVFTGFLIKFTM